MSVTLLCYINLGALNQSVAVLHNGAIYQILNDIPTADLLNKLKQLVQQYEVVDIQLHGPQDLINEYMKQLEEEKNNGNFIN